MTNRSEFFRVIRSALGRTSGTPSVAPVAETALSVERDDALERARAIREDAKTRSAELMDALARSAATAGWKVKRVADAGEAARHVLDIARDLEARAVLRSTHDVLDTLGLESVFDGSGITLETMAVEEVATGSERDAQRQMWREKAIVADIGVTGADWTIAETGTCVLIPRKGLSRVVSLLPPVHIAVVERGQVLPSLDELFALRREAFLSGEQIGYMNLITGPSRTADIEYTIVTGVHGPGEVHMVLIG
jgi:L-lactate utilization protein LutC